VQHSVRRAVMTATASTSAVACASAVCDALASADVVLARIWFVEAGRRALSLAASAGLPAGGGSYHRVDGEFRRVSFDGGKIGRIASLRAALVEREVRGDEDWVANPGWIARQGVRAFAGFPLVAAGDTLGVLALFSRAPLTEATVDDLAFLAEFVAVRLRQLIPPPVTVITRAQLRALEKESIESALVHTRGKVFGTDGAASLLGVKPTTLASRIKALKISVSR
jgi:transcriptional regulator with GAF, ATPase, and Fis domain